MIHHAGTNSLPSVLSLPDVYLHDPLIELQCTDLCCPCHAKWIFRSMSRTTSTEVQIGQNRSSSAREFPTGCLRKLSYRVHEKSAIEIWQPWDLLLDLKTQVQHFHSLSFQSLIFFFFKLASDHIPLIHSLLLVKKRSTVDRQPIHLEAVT